MASFLLFAGYSTGTGMDACGVSMKSNSFVSVASTSFSAAFGYDDSIRLSISKLSSISGFLAMFSAL